jgi:transposase InsO family protein
MIFGLANAPAEFQRLMNQVLGPLLNTKALCYLDDVLIPAKSFEEMIERLREVFECLRKANLTLKLPKCEFGKREVNFLGFVINAEGLKPGLRKVKAIEEFPEPQNVHDVRRFLGLTSFFRRFVKNYAVKAEPLTRLTQKDMQYEWKDEQKKAFEKLKGNLIKQPILAHYDPEAETEVHCDASSTGIAGMLLQKGKDKKWHLVYCISKKTTEAESKYHSSKLELMAIVWTLNRLRQFLIGIKFTIITDCQALVYMNVKKSLNPQITRWFDLIQEFTFEVRHRPGKEMAHVDAMSRAPVLDPDDTLEDIIERKLEVSLTLTESEQILMMQHSDPDLKKLIDIFHKPISEHTKEERSLINEYVFKNNRLFRKVKVNEKDKLLYVIPKSMRKGIAIKFHDLMGHFSVDRTVMKIKELYWFPSMKRYIRRHISMCFECLLNKTPSGRQQGLLHPIQTGRRPFSIVHLDHLGPFVKSSKGNQELLVLIDNFTRFVRLTPVKSTSAQNVLKSLKEFVNEFGLPERIISDRGSCFTSKLFEQYCAENGIKHTLNATKHPQANGMVERANRTILSTITTSMTSKDHKDWDAKIKIVERNLNNFVNNTTNKTPFEMLHGYSPRFNDGIIRQLADDDAEEYKDPKLIQNEVKKIIEEKQSKMKAYYDRKKCRTLKFERGEIVVMRRQPISTGQPTKTQPKYRGPLIVVKVLPGDTYGVTQLEDKEKGHFFATTAHVSQLKPWRIYDDESESDSDEGEQFRRSQPKRNVKRAIRYGL